MKVLYVLDFMRIVDLCTWLSTSVNEASFRLIKLRQLSWKIVYGSYIQFKGATYHGVLIALKTVRVYHICQHRFAVATCIQKVLCQKFRQASAVTTYVYRSSKIFNVGILFNRTVLHTKYYPNPRPASPSAHIRNHNSWLRQRYAVDSLGARDFYLAQTFRLIVWPIQLPVARVPGFFPEGKVAGAWSSLLISI